jgi:ABC-type polysaccharide/polyol phosphate export permease
MHPSGRLSLSPVFGKEVAAASAMSNLQTHSTIIYRIGSNRSRRREALRDILSGFAAAEVWSLLGWQDIKQRYRRSALGPLWLTISTAVLVAMLSFLYGALFNLPIQLYAPFVGTGIVVWGLIASLLNEACIAFIAVDAIVKQVRAPLTLHVCRMVWRNALIFLHNGLILVPLYLVFGKGWHWDFLLLVPAVVALAINGVWAGIVLGVLGARFRDIPPTIANLVQVAFFVTPIMWLPDLLEARGLMWVVDVNPIHHFIEIVRAPILGAPVPTASWEVVVIVTLAGAILSLAVLERYRHRVPYWL